MLVLCAALVGGLGLDVYAHINIIDAATEDFFTPWHGVFYTTFAALAAWVGVIGYRRRSATPLSTWFPQSYRWTVVGLIVFAVGGVGDAIWHTVYGVEVGFDALLSPTHMVLFMGLLLIIWTPVRSSMSRADRSAALAIGGVTLTTVIAVVFLQYLWLLPHSWWAEQTYNPVTESGFGIVQTFLAATIVTAAVLCGPLLVVLGRRSLPFGAATVVWTVVAAVEGMVVSQSTRVVPLAFLGGLAFDTVRWVVDRTVTGPQAGTIGLRAASFAGPATLLGAYLVSVGLDAAVGWPAEVWGGTVFVAGLTGLGLALLLNSNDADPTEFVRIDRP